MVAAHAEITTARSARLGLTSVNQASSPAWRPTTAYGQRRIGRSVNSASALAYPTSAHRIRPFPTTMETRSGRHRAARPPRPSRAPESAWRWPPPPRTADRLALTVHDGVKTAPDQSGAEDDDDDDRAGIEVYGDSLLMRSRAKYFAGSARTGLDRPSAVNHDQSKRKFPQRFVCDSSYASGRRDPVLANAS